jgi:hypothetical protein
VNLLIALSLYRFISGIIFFDSARAAHKLPYLIIWAVSFLVKWRAVRLSASTMAVNTNAEA